MTSTDVAEVHLSQADLFARRMEKDPILRSTIASVLVLDTEPRWPDLLDAFERTCRLVPRLRHVVVDTPLGLAPPRWLPAADFDLSWHVRRVGLPPPAELPSVLDFAGREIMTAFDPVRPLWTCTLLTGMSEGRAAVVLKVHHSLTDGIGAVRIAEQVLDLTRAGGDRPALAEPGAETRGTIAAVAAWHRAAVGGLLRRGPSAALATVGRAVTDPLGLARDATALGRSLARMTRPVTTTLSPVMTRRGTGRRLEALRVPLADLTAAARRAGCTVNDVFVTAVLLGAQEYHRRHGAAIAALRLTMPISVRAPEDPPGGNRITLSRFTVRTEPDDVDAMARAVHRLIDRQRREPAIAWSPAVAAVLNRMPSAVPAAMLEHVDLVASNVPGSPVPLYLAGARVDAVYAFAPTLGTAFNVALVSHVGTCFIGLDVDTAAVPDAPVLRESMEYGFAAVT
ncbi:wax ester/triacylglycerol synthase domain-containing protein [Nocardia takedensis]